MSRIVELIYFKELDNGKEQMKDRTVIPRGYGSQDREHLDLALIGYADMMSYPSDDMK